VTEEKFVKSEGDEVKEIKVFRVAKNKESGSATWTITLDAKVVIAAPYLAGLNRKAPGAARPRTQSFTMKKTPSATGLSKAMPPVKMPPVKLPPVKVPKGIPGMKKKAPPSAESPSA